jgi:branched-chain amino acid transport system permease protein
MTREAIANTVLAIILLAAPAIAWMAGETFYVTLATRMAVLALAAVGLNLALGLGGLVSFGHAAFFGIGGYTAGILSTHALNMTPLLTWPIEVNGSEQALTIWIVAIVVAAFVALVTGAISLRTSGVYFIMITLAFAQMIYYFAISWPTYGGEDGLSIAIRASVPGIDTTNPLQFFLLCYILLMLALFLFWRIQDRASGPLSRRRDRMNDARRSASRCFRCGSAPSSFRRRSQPWPARFIRTSIASLARQCCPGRSRAN